MNEPYQRVHAQGDSNSSVWKGAAFGAGLGAVKLAAVDVPMEMLNRKDTSKMKDGMLKDLTGSLQESASAMTSHDNKYIRGAGKFLHGGGKWRAGRYGTAITVAGLTGAMIAGHNKD